MIFSALTRYILAFSLGSIGVLAFAPYDYFVISLLSTGLLILLWLQCDTKKTSFLTGLFYGLGLFGFGLFWIRVSLQDYGLMPYSLSVLAALALALLLSIYIGLVGFIQFFFRCKHNALRAIIIIPSIWIVVEWLRGLVGGGFPWLSIGYSMLESPLGSFAPIGGLYLVGFLSLSTAGCLVVFLSYLNSARAIKLSAAFYVFSLWIAGYVLVSSSWTEKIAGEEINIGVVQNNVSLIGKWDTKNINNTINEYIDKSMPIDNADVIFWPETAIFNFFDKVDPNLWVILEDHKADYMLGIFHRELSENNKFHFYNAVVSITDVAEDGPLKIGVYKKQKLVPFGEYMPFRSYLDFLGSWFSVPMADLSPYNLPQTSLMAGGVSWGISICYEDIFPNILRKQAKNAKALLNFSEDAWFGDSIAPQQRLQMSQFRALETGRYLVRVSNNGLSAIINHRGEILDITPQFEKAILEGVVELYQGETPYVRYGNFPILLVVISALFLFGLGPLLRLFKSNSKAN